MSDTLINKGVIMKKEILINEIVSQGTKWSFSPFSLEFAKKQLQMGKELKPITVIKRGKKFFIEDGEHRFQALQELGIKGNIKVNIIKE